MSVRSARKSSRGCCSLFLWPFIILMVLGVFWNSSHKAESIDAALAMALGLKAYDLLSNQNEPVRTNSENISAEEGSFSQNADSSQQNSNSGSNVSDGSSAADDSITYVVNTNTGKFHYPDCPSVSTIADHNRMDSTETRDQLIAEGYQPCKRCNP